VVQPASWSPSPLCVAGIRGGCNLQSSYSGSEPRSPIIGSSHHRLLPTSKRGEDNESTAAAIAAPLQNSPTSPRHSWCAFQRAQIPPDFLPPPLLFTQLGPPSLSSPLPPPRLRSRPGQANVHPPTNFYLSPRPIGRGSSVFVRSTFGRTTLFSCKFEIVFTHGPYLVWYRLSRSGPRTVCLSRNALLTTHAQAPLSRYKF